MIEWTRLRSHAPTKNSDPSATTSIDEIYLSVVPLSHRRDVPLHRQFASNASSQNVRVADCVRWYGFPSAQHALVGSHYASYRGHVWSAVRVQLPEAEILLAEQCDKSNASTAVSFSKSLPWMSVLGSGGRDAATLFSRRCRSSTPSAAEPPSPSGVVGFHCQFLQGVQARVVQVDGNVEIDAHNNNTNRAPIAIGDVNGISFLHDGLSLASLDQEEQHLLSEPTAKLKSMDVVTEIRAGGYCVVSSVLFLRAPRQEEGANGRWVMLAGMLCPRSQSAPAAGPSSTRRASTNVCWAHVASYNPQSKRLYVLEPVRTINCQALSLYWEPLRPPEETPTVLDGASKCGAVSAGGSCAVATQVSPSKKEIDEACNDQDLHQRADGSKVRCRVVSATEPLYDEETRMRTGAITSQLTTTRSETMLAPCEQSPLGNGTGASRHQQQSDETLRQQNRSHSEVLTLPLGPSLPISASRRNPTAPPRQPSNFLSHGHVGAPVVEEAALREKTIDMSRRTTMRGDSETMHADPFQHWNINVDVAEERASTALVMDDDDDADDATRSEVHHEHAPNPPEGQDTIHTGSSCSSHSSRRGVFLEPLVSRPLAIDQETARREVRGGGRASAHLMRRSVPTASRGVYRANELLCNEAIVPLSTPQTLECLDPTATLSEPKWQPRDGTVANLLSALQLPEPKRSGDFGALTDVCGEERHRDASPGNADLRAGRVASTQAVVAATTRRRTSAAFDRRTLPLENIHGSSTAIIADPAIYLILTGVTATRVRDDRIQLQRNQQQPSESDAASSTSSAEVPDSAGSSGSSHHTSSRCLPVMKVNDQCPWLISVYVHGKQYRITQEGFSMLRVALPVEHAIDGSLQPLEQQPRPLRSDVSRAGTIVYWLGNTTRSEMEFARFLERDARVAQCTRLPEKGASGSATSTKAWISLPLQQSRSFQVAEVLIKFLRQEPNLALPLWMLEAWQETQSKKVKVARQLSRDKRSADVSTRGAAERRHHRSPSHVESILGVAVPSSATLRLRVVSTKDDSHPHVKARSLPGSATTRQRCPNHAMTSDAPSIAGHTPDPAEREASRVADDQGLSKRPGKGLRVGG